MALSSNRDLTGTAVGGYEWHRIMVFEEAGCEFWIQPVSVRAR